MDELTLACEKLGVDPALVVKSRADFLTGEYFVLVDYGIGGVKKYSVLLADLQQPEPVLPDPEPVAPKRSRKAGK